MGVFTHRRRTGRLRPTCATMFSSITAAKRVILHPGALVSPTFLILVITKPFQLQNSQCCLTSPFWMRLRLQFPQLCRHTLAIMQGVRLRRCCRTDVLMLRNALISSEPFVPLYQAFICNLRLLLL